MASAVSQMPVRPAPPPPPSLNTTVLPSRTASSPKPLSPASSNVQHPNPIRSMLDVDVPAGHATIPEETHSNDGSEEPHEAVTPTSNGAHHQFHHVGGDQPEHVTDFTKPLTPLATPSPEQAVVSNPIDIPQTIVSTASPPKSASEARKPFARKATNTTPSRGSTPVDSSPPSPKDGSRPTFLKKAKTFFRSNSKLDSMVDQYAPRSNGVRDQKDQGDEMSAPSRTTTASKTSETNVFTLSSRSSHTSRTNSPPSPGTPNSTVQESVEEVENDRLTKSKTSSSVQNLNRYSHPRSGITWGNSVTNEGLSVPMTNRRRSASTEQVSKIRKPNQPINEEDDEDEHFEAPLQATFSTRAGEGVGLKARRLSLTLPDDFVVLTKPLEKEYKSARLFHSKGTLVGKGATAKVTSMQRRDGSKDELFAVKEFRSRDKDESEYEWSQKIKSEYTLANSVNHPNIVRTFDLCMDKHNRYNHVMEFCPIELFALAEKGLFKSYYDEKAKLCFFKQILRAVDYLHDHGIAHRDIKLENILMDANGHLKLTDFGVSEVFCGEHPGARASGGQCGMNMGEKKLCPPGICGSLPYISPEVMSRNVSYDPSKLDVWSCGVLWMCLAFSGNLWSVPEEKNENYAKFMKGWRNWISEHPQTTPNETTGYPKCGNFMAMIGTAAMKKLVLRMMHPDPDYRITIHDALNSAAIKGAECCSPESFEDMPCMIDAKDWCKKKPKASVKIFKHNHLPPKDNKVGRALTHRFDMGDGYS